MPYQADRTTRNSRSGVQWNRTQESIRTQRPAMGVGTRTAHTVHGVMVAAVGGQGVPTSGEDGAKPVPYKLASEEANHLVCHTWNGTTEGTTEIRVAKPTKLRQVASEDIDGWVVNYVYGGIGRTATFEDATTEAQAIVPCYLVGDVIWTMEVDDSFVTSGSPATTITILDINVDGRAWAKV
jgi:hypothetical protein